LAVIYLFITGLLSLIEGQKGRARDTP